MTDDSSKCDVNAIDLAAQPNGSLLDDKAQSNDSLLILILRKHSQMAPC